MKKSKVEGEKKRKEKRRKFDIVSRSSSYSLLIKVHDVKYELGVN